MPLQWCRPPTIPISPPPLPRYPASPRRRRASATRWLPSGRKVEVENFLVGVSFGAARGGVMMRLNRYLTAIGLTLLLALPAVAQIASPSKSPSSAAAIKLAQARQIVDINSASAEALDKLPGIG